MKSAMRVGLIGAGRIGRVHAENLVYRVPEADLVAIADVYVEAAEEVATQFGIPAAHKDHRRIMDDTSIDAVLICSSTDTHAQFIEEAAEAGKQIFCEKPIALDLNRIDAALDAVDRAVVKLMIGFNRRFDPNFARVRDVVAAGGIGEPHILRIISRDPGPPPIDYIKVSGGIFLDMTIHDFDMARFLVGAEVESVYAAGGVMVDPAIGSAGDIDTALVTVRFENGVLGSIDNSRKAVYGYDQRVEVFGSKGAVSADNNYPNTVVISDAGRIHHDLPLNFFMERYTQAYVNEIRAFVDSILNETAPPVTGLDGRAPVVMGYAAKKSLEEGRPVKLSEISA